MIDIGTQFVKSNPLGFGDGADHGSVQYSIMKCTINPPVTDHGGGSGYTQGVGVLAGKNWFISNNLFDNLHTPDSADNLWNPAILMWNGAANTIVQNNVFINVDRAIAFGLIDRVDDHHGGVIRNNMIVMQPNLYSSSRKASSDAAILVWSSPDTWVLHNTIFTRGNTHKSIELRFKSSGSIVRNNLVDAPITDRSYSTFDKAGNVEYHGPDIFGDLSSATFRWQSAVDDITGVVPILVGARKDIDGDTRGCGRGFTDVGAHEFGSDNNKC